MAAGEAAVANAFSCTSAGGASASHVVGQTPQRVHWFTEGQGAVERASWARSCSRSINGRPKPASTISHGRISSWERVRLVWNAGSIPVSRIAGVQIVAQARCGSMTHAMPWLRVWRCRT